MNLRFRYFRDFFALVFPENCQACNQSLARQEKLICTSCLYELPYTNFHNHHDHVVARQFWGKINLRASYALLYFIKGSRVQRLMHRFKYKNMPGIGNALGRIAGKQLASNDIFKTVDIIIPVPLHPSRMRKRGYNQSTRFAEGIAEVMGAEVMEDSLVRKRATETQTRKSRLERYENMKSVFMVSNPHELTGKHILLVDDIMTTGSTLEACGRTLLEIEGVTLSIAAIAYAE